MYYHHIDVFDEAETLPDLTLCHGRLVIVDTERERERLQ